MFLLQFVNQVRAAQGYEPIEVLPLEDGSGASPLELAMGCRLGNGLMELSSSAAALAVAEASGLPLGIDGVTVAMPAALGGHPGVAVSYAEPGPPLEHAV